MSFDPTTFLDQRTDEISQKRPPIPAGTELLGTIGELKITANPAKDDPERTVVRLAIPIKLDLTTNPQVLKEIGQDSVTITHSIFLDYTEDGALDYAKGKNPGLKRYRDATGLNRPGFGLRDLQGHVVKARISHRLYEGDTFDQIDSVVKP